MTKQQLLDKIPSDNIEWAAQVILNDFNECDLSKLKTAIQKLDGTLYKSWAKCMTFEEVYSAVKLASSY